MRSLFVSSSAAASSLRNLRGQATFSISSTATVASSASQYARLSPQRPSSTRYSSSSCKTTSVPRGGRIAPASSPTSLLSLAPLRPSSFQTTTQHLQQQSRHHAHLTRPEPGTGIKVHFKDSKGNPIKTIEGNEGDDLLSLAHEWDVDLEGELKVCQELSRRRHHREEDCRNCPSLRMTIPRSRADCSSFLSSLFSPLYYLSGACEGSIACSTCHVILTPETYDLLEEPGDDENDMLDLAFGLTDTSRLGCQIKLTKEMDGMVAQLPSATRNMRVDGAKAGHGH